MSTINFNLKNKDQVQIKNEILNKMSKIRESYNIDSNYHELFFNLVQNSNNKNNLKLSINKHGNYSLKTVGGNPGNGNGKGNATVTGNVNPNNEQSVLDDIGESISSVGEIFSDKKIKSVDIEEDEETGDVVKGEGGPVEGDGVSGDGVSGDGVSGENSEEGPVVPEEDGDGSKGGPEYEEELERTVVTEEGPDRVQGDGSKGGPEYEEELERTVVTEEGPDRVQGDGSKGGPEYEEEPKKGIFSALFGIGGGQSDSEYESDDSLLSSDDEAEDIIPYTTAVFDDDEDDDMMDHIRNMRSKKYLKNLNNTQLRDILKTNNQKITTGGSYLTKEQMVKSIKKYYK